MFPKVLGSDLVGDCQHVPQTRVAQRHRGFCSSAHRLVTAARFPGRNTLLPNEPHVGSPNGCSYRCNIQVMNYAHNGSRLLADLVHTVLLVECC